MVTPTTGPGLEEQLQETTHVRAAKAIGDNNGRIPLEVDMLVLEDKDHDALVQAFENDPTLAGKRVEISSSFINSGIYHRFQAHNLQIVEAKPDHGYNSANVAFEWGRPLRVHTSHYIVRVSEVQKGGQG